MRLNQGSVQPIPANQAFVFNNFPDYPDPLPAGMEALQGGGWSAILYFNSPLAFTATAILENEAGEVVDKITVQVPADNDNPIIGTIGVPGYSIQSGTLYTGALDGLQPEFYHMQQVDAPMYRRTNSLGSDVYLWGPYYIHQRGGFYPSQVYFPASRFPVPAKGRIRIESPIGDTFLPFIAGTANPVFYATLDAPQVTLTTRGTEPEDFAPSGPDAVQAEREYPYYSAVSSVEYWWQEKQSGEWKHSVGGTLVKDWFESQHVYILLKDIDGGQGLVKRPLIIRDRAFATCDEVISAHGRFFQSVEAEPLTFAGGDGFNEVTMERGSHVVEIVQGVRHIRFAYPGVGSDLTNGFRNSPGIIRTRGGMLLFWVTNSRVALATGPIGSGDALLFASRDESKTWTLVGYMWNSQSIRVAKMAELTDGALATVAVSSTDWTVDPLTEPVTRKLLFKRSKGMTSDANNVLTVFWPDDSAAIEIDEVDRVEVWTIRQEKSGFIILSNGRGTRYTSSTTNPQVPSDWVKTVDEVAP